jgi:signal transduction histidine kinase/ligand-binding sensor domain-containing protein
MIRPGFFVFIFSFLSATLSAQDFFYSTRNYTAIDGLPQSQVRALVEDKSGYLWIGTEGGGLARFDGREFKVYTTLDGLLTNQVIGLKFDTEDNLLILHPRGVTKFDGLQFKKFQTPVSHPTAAKPIRRAYQLKDTLFLLSSNGSTSKIYKDSIYYWEKDIYQDRQIWASHVAPGGEVCLFLSDGSVVIRSENKTYSFPGDVDKTGKINNVFNYKQEVLFRSMKGMFRLDVKNRSVEKLSWEIPHFVLLYDQKENKFWTTDGSIFFKETVKDGVVKTDTVLKDISINQVLIDSEGNTWFASNGNGLYKYFIQDFIRSSADNVRGVMAILMDHEGSSWVGTMNKGLWKTKKGKTTSYIDEKESYRNMIHCIKESADGTIWIGTADGLGKYDREKDLFHWYTREDGLPGYSVMSIEFDEKGMWVGTGNGLSFYDGNSFKNYNTENGLAANGIWALRYMKKLKTLFIGSDVAVNTLKDGKIDLVPIPEMVNTSVSSLQVYQDSLLLIGTGGTGVVMLNPITNKRRFITTRDGMASDFVYFAAADNNDYLWVGTEKGINHVKLDKKFEVVENLHFNYDNGLTGVETNQNAFYLSPTSKYFGLVDGLYEFNDLNKQRQRSFDVHLTDVQILYGEYSPRAYADSTFGFFKIPFKPSLPPDKNHLTFQFNRVDKRYSKSVRYKYLLENFDKTWSLPSAVNEVTYSNLPPGNYTFRVMSTNNKGSWSDTKISYNFTIKTPFYRNASFIVGMFIFVGGLITLILYIRVKQRVNGIVMLERIRQKEQDNLRKEIARDFHDEMGNQLSRIINYVSLLKLNGNGNGNGHDLYTKVESSAKYLYSGTRDFIWSIDPVNDELSKLFIHIRDFGEKLFEEKSINFRAFNEVKEKIKLPYGFSREANLIFKEAMTNAFKSSEAKNVALTLKRDENNGFEMTFEDDGVGFHTGEIEKSNGLQNIRERANRINALLRILSVKNEGTKIVLNFTLTKTLKYGLTL